MRNLCLPSGCANELSLRLHRAAVCVCGAPCKCNAVHPQEKWDQTEEKPAVVAITLASFVAIWAASGVVDAIDKLPLIGGLLEFVGLIVTGWCVTCLSPVPCRLQKSLCVHQNLMIRYVMLLSKQPSSRCFWVWAAGRHTGT